MAKKKRIRYAQIILMISAVLFVFVWENIQATKLGYRIEQTRQEIKSITNANKYLSKDIQIALSPEKLQEKALMLGMIYPEPEQIVILEKNNNSNKKNLGWFAWAR
ncbi:MAG: hypothetical protein KAR84_08120 [Elusimicrobiales bacterium]|nr:hypothetical protein [Elusimicrobiales bacterium]MCK5106441.1 hypothetical protein [Elusimicrobiales bacterium]